jgi:hypothetical protein
LSRRRSQPDYVLWVSYAVHAVRTPAYYRRPRGKVVRKPSASFFFVTPRHSAVGVVHQLIGNKAYGIFALSGEPADSVIRLLTSLKICVRAILCAAGREVKTGVCKKKEGGKLG